MKMTVEEAVNRGILPQDILIPKELWGKYVFTFSEEGIRI
jgi:hypothetical protein